MKKTLLSFLIVAAPLYLLAQLPSYLPTNGLVGWWPFNGNANDESGNGHNGAVNGATLCPDRFNNANSAYYFNGISDFISVPHSSVFNMQQSTWIVWVKIPSTTGGNGYYIMGIQDNALHHVTFHEFQGYSGSQIGWAPGQAAGVGGSNLVNNWHMLAITYDQSISTNNFTFYFDGQQGSTSTIQPFSFNNGDLRFGINSNNGYWERLNGQVDDAVMYNRILTQEEITALYTGVPTDNNSGDNTASTAVPAGISYQAIARNMQGQPMSETAVQVRFTLLTDSLTGAVEYSESHSIITNSLGLFTTAFGTGTPLSATFEEIDWASGNKYLKVELDAGNGFAEIGTQQLLSVPYAMRSNTSAKAGTIENTMLPVYANNAEALAGGLQPGQIYRTDTGDLKIVF